LPYANENLYLIYCKY